MIFSYSNPGMIKGGLSESSFMTPSSPQESRTLKGKGNRIQNPVLQRVFLCASLPPHHASAFWKEMGSARPGPSSSPAQLSLCPPPASSRWCPGSRCQPC